VKGLCAVQVLSHESDGTVLASFRGCFVANVVTVTLVTNGIIVVIIFAAAVAAGLYHC
jgi:hypothetical protein